MRVRLSAVAALKTSSLEANTPASSNAASTSRPRGVVDDFELDDLGRIRRFGVGQSEQLRHPLLESHAGSRSPFEHFEVARGELMVVPLFVDRGPQEILHDVDRRRG